MFNYFTDIILLIDAETESQHEVKITGDLSVDTKLCRLENDIGSNKVSQEVRIILFNHVF